MRSWRLLACGLLLVVAWAGKGSAQGSGSAACGEPPANLGTFTQNVRDTLRREYAEPLRFTYLEKRQDIDVSMLGKVSVGPRRTFEVYPQVYDDYKRLIAIEGKPLDPAELVERDAEHQRNLLKQAERERTESPQRRAARLKKREEELRERDAIIDDAAAVFEFAFVCREMVGGEPLVVFTLKPRQHARVQTREGGWMKKFEGRIWVSESGHHIARLRLRANDEVSVGWGVVARVEQGSGFDYVRKRIGDTWVPLQLTVEGSGRTLLFRRFQVRTVTTYSNHQPYAGSPGGFDRLPLSP
jgi:hypothetical protein